MSSISLIIATYNWPEALELCLLSSKYQTMYPIEVIIADDGSDESTRAVIEKVQQDFPIPLIHIWHEDRGFRKSIILNKAVKRASGDYIVQIDGDVIIDKHFIEDHCSAAEKGFFVRGTRAHIIKSSIQKLFDTKKINLKFWSAGIIHKFNAIRIPALSFLVEKKLRNSNSVRGSNLAYWKSDFVLINGYNNDLQGWGHEDEELAARFINNDKLKKAIKFKAVQFHFSHKEAARTSEPGHIEVLKNTLNNRLKVCSNGYAQS